MGFSSKNTYNSAATSTIPVVTQNHSGESLQVANQISRQKKGLLSTILSSHRNMNSAESQTSANKTLG